VKLEVHKSWQCNYSQSPQENVIVQQRHMSQERLNFLRTEFRWKAAVPTSFTETHLQIPGEDLLEKFSAPGRRTEFVQVEHVKIRLITSCNVLKEPLAFYAACSEFGLQSSLVIPFTPWLVIETHHILGLVSAAAAQQRPTGNGVTPELHRISYLISVQTD
jgi:hypothetical protein